MTNPVLMDERADIIVVGSGAGALTAAVTAAELGAKVIVVEKAHLYGGTSATSGGTIWIPCSHLQPPQARDTPEDALHYLKQLAGDVVPESKLRTYVARAPEMLKFLTERCEQQFESVPYPDYHTDLPGSREGWRSHDPAPIRIDEIPRHHATLQPPHPSMPLFGKINFTSKEFRPLIRKESGWGGLMFKIIARYYLDFRQRLKSRQDRRLTMGNALVARLRAAANKRKVQIWLSSPLDEFMVENGRVVGVTVRRRGATQKLYATHGVIVGAGGFERNGDMRRQYLPKPTAAEWTVAQPYNTGDAIRAGQRIGARTALMDQAWWAPGYRLEDCDRAHPLFLERAMPNSLIVDQNGVRFMNEAASYHVAGARMLAHGPSAAPAFLIFDRQFRAKYALGPMFPGPPSMDARVRRSMRELVRRADSLAELAAQVGVDAATLEATVGRFNGFAQTGKDLDFGRGDTVYDRYYSDPHVKPNPNLGPVSKPPFYALPIYPCDIGTKGGFATDECARVIGENGAPISGLYAIGNCAASLMGKSYPGAGSTLGPAMTFGYIAARSAMEASLEEQAPPAPRVRLVEAGT